MLESVLNYSDLIAQGLMSVANWSLATLYLFTAIVVQFSLRWEAILIRDLGIPIVRKDDSSNFSIDTFQGGLVKNMNEELQSNRRKLKIVNWIWVAFSIAFLVITAIEVIVMACWGKNN